MNTFRLVVAGGRDFNNFFYLTAVLDKLLEDKILTHNVVIVSGMARGADTLGERYAKMRRLDIDYHLADWDRYGKSAGYRRNEQMALSSDASCVFWDGKSKGSAHMIDLTKKSNNALRVVMYQPKEVV